LTDSSPRALSRSRPPASAGRFCGRGVCQVNARAPNIPLPHPLARHLRRRPASLAEGDRVLLCPAYIDIPPDLGSPIVEDGFEVKSTARRVVYIYRYGARRCQEVGTQQIDIPNLGAAR